MAHVRTSSSPSVQKWLPRLIPFFVTAAMYMLHFKSLDQSVKHTISEALENPPTYYTAFLKCCPMIVLIAFVAAHEEASPTSEKVKLKYKAGIAIGLTLGCIGDACLVFPETFIPGMVAFALGHAFYIYSYGFSPLKGCLGITLYLLCAILLIFVRARMPDPLIKEAMPFYSIFLVTMCWRAVARVNSSVWTKVGALGGILFVISDFFLVLQFQADIRYGELIVMTTYYLSQMCTALSVLESSSHAKKD